MHCVFCKSLQQIKKKKNINGKWSARVFAYVHFRFHGKEFDSSEKAKATVSWDQKFTMAWRRSVEEKNCHPVNDGLDEWSGYATPLTEAAPVSAPLVWGVRQTDMEKDLVFGIDAGTAQAFGTQLQTAHLN